MKLIHCADLHLDSPMGTHMTIQQASARNTQIIDSFLRLTDFARENGVRAVIIAGDLFDGTRVRSRTVDEILAAMERTPEVDYLYLPGNHDGAARAFSDQVLPGSRKKVWWQCAEGHSWQAVVYSRTGSQSCGCPICSGHVKRKQRHGAPDSRQSR